MTGKGTIGDAAYIVHEIAEVRELRRIQRQTGFDFMKKNLRTFRELGQWENDFERYYKQAHSKALEAEYKFIAQQVIEVSNGRVKISFLQAAAIDPTRRIRPGAEETEGALYLFVEGKPLQEHYHFNAWCRGASKVVSLSKSSQKRLGYYRSQITLSVLIAYIKKRPLK